MANRYGGACQCGGVELSVRLPKLLGEYFPRACDCDFCTTRGLAYLSDPNGSAEIISKAGLGEITQGSEQAQFLCCTSCNDVVAVAHLFSAGLKGAINASLINSDESLQSAIAASPKLLKPAEKLERWQSVWLRLTVANS